MKTRTVNILELINKEYGLKAKIKAIREAFDVDKKKAKKILRKTALDLIENPDSIKNGRWEISKIMRDIDISKGMSHKEKLQLVDKINNIFKPRA